MHRVRWTLVPALAVAGALALIAGCGSDDSDDDPARSPAGNGRGADLAAVKAYLLDHAAALTEATADLRAQAEAYYELARNEDFDYRALLRERRAEVARVHAAAQDAFKRANPAYEEMEGIVAGVPALAQYDVILDAGSPASEDPEGAVPFDLRLPDGRVLEQPGNFFFLTETSLWGTNEEFVARGVEPDLDGDGTVEFGEAIPDASFLLAAAREFDRYANELQRSAREFEPTNADALGALVIMTPTMSEYFAAWKNSRFIAGEGATELGFVAASRLSDIADILSGLVFVYDEVEPVVAKADPQQAALTQRSLIGLRDFAARLRDQEAAGRRFTAQQADTLGAEAQRRAEAIAGQISQAAAKLDIQLPEA